MFKGKYVLISMNELKWKISDYLKVNNALIIDSESSHILLEIEKSDIIGNGIKEFTARMVGEDTHLINDLTFDFEYSEKLVFNITECTYMFKKIFEIDENISFDDEVMFINDNEDIYMFYVDLN